MINATSNMPMGGPGALKCGKPRNYAEAFGRLPELMKSPFASGHAGVANSLKLMARSFREPIKVPDLVRVTGLSRRGFQKAFHKHTGLMPGRVLQCLRINHARQLLVETKLQMKDVAAASGFRKVNTFGISFRNITGFTPMEFRRRAGVALKTKAGRNEARRVSRKWPVGVGLLVAFVALMVANTLALAGGDIETANDHKVRVVLVGDSTVTDKSGWGLGFSQFVTDGIECSNTAAGGRSSKSFRDEGKWTNALALKGDYYLIQFGHNNEPGKPGRSTDMPTFVQDMKNYVDEARAVGAKPILITPLTRRQWDKTTNGKIKSSLMSYAEEVKKIGVEKHVPVLDLHARSIEVCEQLGREECLKFSPMKVVAGTNTVDNTHLNAQGSVMFARLVVEELRKAAPELATGLRTEPMETKPAPPEVNSGDAKLRAALAKEKGGAEEAVFNK